MKKRVFGRKLKRDVNERKALFKGLMSSLVLNEKIETTEAKGKAIKGEIDKLVTKAKKENILARKLLSPKLSPEALEKMIRDIAPRFSKRQGGYTKTVRLGKRFGDDASMVLIEWTEKSQISNLKSQNLDENKSTKAENRPEPKNKKSTKLKKEVKKPAESKTRKRTVRK
ncbi:MAG: 50S ribosomal protein L17 [Patescibacteria group bacterium]|nr:50S ribosomal protein L17 [Patescibacteria group bacterium]